jgi:hypothetical protein
MRQWNGSHKESVSNTKALYYYMRGGKEKMLTHKLKVLYGLTLEELNAMWERQKGLCKICGKVLTRAKNGYAVDHVHGSDPVIVRGLLCGQCNTGIRMLEDKDLKTKAESYLLTK